MEIEIFSQKNTIFSSERRERKFFLFAVEKKSLKWKKSLAMGLKYLFTFKNFFISMFLLKMIDS